MSKRRGREVASRAVDWAAVASQQVSMDVRCLLSEGLCCKTIFRPQMSNNDFKDEHELEP